MSDPAIRVAAFDGSWASESERVWAAQWLSVAVGTRIDLAASETGSASAIDPRKEDRFLLPRITAHLLRGRPPAELQSPILDRQIADLRSRVAQAFPERKLEAVTPSPFRFAIVVTHDVDSVDRWTTQHVRHLAQHIPERLGIEGLRSVFRLPYAFVRRFWDQPEVASRVQACIDLESEFDVAATYLFFSAIDRYRSALDGWYTPDTPFLDRTLEQLWNDLQGNGFDVGLHLSIGAHDNPEAIEAELKSMTSMGYAVRSCRSHYVSDREGVTHPTLARLGVTTDLNLVANGYSLGTGFPFAPVRPGTLRLPTVLTDRDLPMDVADSSAPRLWERWKPLLEEASANGSVATILVHPCKAGSASLLRLLFEWGRENGAWFCSAAEFMAHWLARRDRILDSSRVQTPEK